MSEIIDPDYDPEAVQEKIGSLPDDHKWYWFENPNGTIDKIALPDFTENYQPFTLAEVTGERS